MMANLNLGQDVVNKGERKQTDSCLIQQTVWMLRYGSLININPSGLYYTHAKVHIRRYGTVVRGVEPYSLEPPGQIWYPLR